MSVTVTTALARQYVTLSGRLTNITIHHRPDTGRDFADALLDGVPVTIPPRTLRQSRRLLTEGADVIMAGHWAEEPSTPVDLDDETWTGEPYLTVFSPTVIVPKGDFIELENLDAVTPLLTAAAARIGAAQARIGETDLEITPDTDLGRTLSSLLLRTGIRVTRDLDERAPEADPAFHVVELACQVLEFPRPITSADRWARATANTPRPADDRPWS